MFNSSRLAASVAGICLGCLVFANTANAQSVFLKSPGPFYWGPSGGGEFDAVPAKFFGHNPVRLTMDADGKFETFCLEAQVDIFLGQAYQVNFPGLMAQSGYTLNEEVAWIYHQFINKLLTNYDYEDDDFNPFDPGNPGVRQTDAGALAYAVWELGGQDTSGHTFNPSPSKTAAWKADAIAAAAANPGEFYNVELLELYRPNQRGELTYFQSVLFEELIPAPSSAALLALGGLIAARRRRT